MNMMTGQKNIYLLNTKTKSSCSLLKWITNNKGCSAECPFSNSHYYVFEKISGFSALGDKL